ncbi:MAG: hypothetical protein HRT45_02720 [Bdellovibrionales bacterium]|nr:hypothetical protein [Bdellovibrionales bacterium]
MKWFLILALTAFSIGCAQKETAEQKAENLNSWRANMGKLGHSLGQLLPTVSQPEMFFDPANEKRIESEIENFASSAHSIKVQKKPEADPSLAFVSKKFENDVDQALKEFKKGNKKHARFLIKDTTNYCISCHSRTDSGRSDWDFSSFAKLNKMRPLDRAEFLMSVRDFDKALQTYDEIIYDKNRKASSSDLESSGEKALAIAVRVKRDPDLANELVSRIVDSKTAPIFLRLNARQWKSAIKSWKSDKSEANMKPSEKLKYSYTLMARGWKLSQSSVYGKAGLVHYLRASSIIHEILSDDSNSKLFGQALYYAGLAAESLRDINFWTLHETYYESCIRHSPFSTLAKKCYLRLEGVFRDSYTPYQGAPLPKYVSKRLFNLRALVEKDTSDISDWGFFE